ncbi:hypothetical protein RI367_005158 [Sorochytrium milnesiophthora]
MPLLHEQPYPSEPQILPPPPPVIVDRPLPVDIDLERAHLETQRMAALLQERTRDVLKSDFDVMMASFEVAKFEEATNYYESLLHD